MAERTGVSVAGIMLDSALKLCHCFSTELRNSVHRCIGVAFHLLPKSMNSLNVVL